MHLTQERGRAAQAVNSVVCSVPTATTQSIFLSGRSF